MPSLSKYRTMINPNRDSISTISEYSYYTNGNAHKSESDEIMEATWYNDLNAQTAYFYDYYHDSEPYTLRGLHPESDEKKIPIDIKFLQYSSQTYDKDYVSFHIQFKPSFRYEDYIEYYNEVFSERYGAIFPVGLFVDIKDESGNYNKWLVVGTANYYTTQFPTYEILPCNYILQYVYKNIKYQIAVVLRNQNS